MPLPHRPAPRPPAVTARVLADLWVADLWVADLVVADLVVADLVVADLVVDLGEVRASLDLETEDPEVVERLVVAGEALIRQPCSPGWTPIVIKKSTRRKCSRSRNSYANA